MFDWWIRYYVPEVLLSIGLVLVLHNLLVFCGVVVYWYQTVLVVFSTCLCVLVLYYTTKAGIDWINKTFEEDKIL